MSSKTIRASAVLVVLVAAVMLAACEEARAPGNDGDDVADGTATSQPTEPDSGTDNGSDEQLIGPEWVLQRISGNDPIDGTSITLQFGGDRLSGFGGCNHYGGSYEIEEDTILVPEIESDDQACLEPEGVMRQERELFEILMQDGNTYEVTDTKLEVSNPDGGPSLVFTRREPSATDMSDLDGTDWMLISFDDDGVLEGSRLTLGFDGREFHGYAGCRSFEGSVQSGGDRVHVGYLGMTSLDCLRPERFRLQEGRYIDGISSAAYLDLAGGQFELHTRTGDTLLFEPLTDKAGHEPEDATWVLDHSVLDGHSEPALPGTEVTVTFEDGVIYARGQISGSGGCNNYSAEYSLDGSSLQIEMFEVTEMGCVEPDGIMQQEQNLIEILNATPSYSVEGDELQLSTDDGDTLVLTEHDEG